MNKLDLIEALKNDAGVGKKEATAAVELLFDKISEALASGDRVEIRHNQLLLQPLCVRDRIN